MHRGASGGGRRGGIPGGSSGGSQLWFRDAIVVEAATAFRLPHPRGEDRERLTMDSFRSSSFFETGVCGSTRRGIGVGLTQRGGSLRRAWRRFDDDGLVRLVPRRRSREVRRVGGRGQPDGAVLVLGLLG